MTRVFRSPRVPLIARGLALAACIAALAAPAVALDGEPGERLGLSAMSSPSGGLLGFLNNGRLSHSRSLSFGYAAASGSYGFQTGGAAYTDFFSYRLRENLTVDLALRYSFTTDFRSAVEERGQFSVLPSFALEYHPGANTLLRVSYERLGPVSPFALGRRGYPF